MFRKTMKTTVFTAVCLASLLTFSYGFLEPMSAQDSSSREGLPGRRVGGGTRGECSLGEKSLMALMPETNLGLTVATHPTLFFYIPQTDTPKTVEFVLRDERDNQVYEKTFTVNGMSGIISLNLPTTELSPLTIGKNYQWYFSIICNPRNRAEDVSVEGWIQRVAPNQMLATKLEKATLEERLAVYTSEGYWQDALVTLAQLRRDRPQDPAVNERWTTLLQSAGLNAIEREPLLP